MYSLPDSCLKNPPGLYVFFQIYHSQQAAQDQYTYCFNVGTDKSKTPMTLNGMTWSVKKTGIDVGTAYSSDDKNVKFKWQAYNLDTKKWSRIADWNGNLSRVIIGFMLKQQMVMVDLMSKPFVLQFQQTLARIILI